MFLLTLTLSFISPKICYIHPIKLSWTNWSLDFNKEKLSERQSSVNPNQSKQETIESSWTLFYFCFSYWFFEVEPLLFHSKLKSTYFHFIGNIKLRYLHLSNNCLVDGNWNFLNIFLKFRKYYESSIFSCMEEIIFLLQHFMM